MITSYYLLVFLTQPSPPAAADPRFVLKRRLNPSSLVAASDAPAAKKRRGEQEAGTSPPEDDSVRKGRTATAGVSGAPIYTPCMMREELSKSLLGTTVSAECGRCMHCFSLLFLLL